MHSKLISCGQYNKITNSHSDMRTHATDTHIGCMQQRQASWLAHVENTAALKSGAKFPCSNKVKEAGRSRHP